MADPTRDTHDAQPKTARRIPAGLTMAMLAAAISLALMLIGWHLRWSTDRPLAFIVHASALLCLAWGLVAHFICRGASSLRIDSPRHDAVSVLAVVQLVFGLIVAVIMTFIGLLAIFARLYQPLQVKVDIWPGGTLDLAVLAIAVLLAWWRTGHGALMTSLMWLMLLMALWSALKIPAYLIRELHGIPHNVPSDWISPLALGAAFVVAAFTALRGSVEHLRRVHAWPDHLEDLLTPAPAWPGFGYSAGIIAAIVLVLGCIAVVSPLTPLAALLAGASMLTLATRRWNENFADAGLGLMTLGVVSLLMLGTADSSVSRADYYAAVFSRALLGLALMTAFWHWQAAVWNQQLDNHVPWTTAGRLIRPCHRVGFLMGTTGVLVSVHLSFWPKLPYVYTSDNTLSRWLWGLLGNLVLIAALTRSARRTAKPTLAWLAIFAMVSTLTFILVRVDGTVLYSGFFEYWPLLLAAIAGLLLWAARGAHRSTPWKPFFEPTFVLGTLIVPVAAIAGAALTPSHSIPQWVEPATFAMLAVVYLLAAWLTGPRRFLILTFVCIGAALWNLRLH